MTFPSNSNIDPETIPDWRLELTIEECKVLYKLFEHHYIHYDNEEAHKIINKMIAFLKEHDKS